MKRGSGPRIRVYHITRSGPASKNPYEKITESDNRMRICMPQGMILKYDGVRVESQISPAAPGSISGGSRCIAFGAAGQFTPLRVLARGARHAKRDEIILFEYLGHAN